MSTNSWLIWDLDGTLVDNRHRLHHIQKPDPDWKSYVAEVQNDRPYDSTVALLDALHVSGRYHHAIVTGRIQDEGEQTHLWLASWGLLHYFTAFYYRASGDFRPAAEIKVEIVKREFFDRNRHVAAVFEDHPKIVEALRGIGVQCLHVREYF